MFGKNTPLKQFIDSGERLQVHEIFYTIQGEGPLAGCPAVFCRLSGCNLKCHFCDTKFEGSKWNPTVDELVHAICLASTGMEVVNEDPQPVEGPKVKPASGRGKRITNHVVLTGGEPLRQNILPLVEALNASGLLVQIETAGTLTLPGLGTRFASNNDPRMCNTIVCSPKTAVINDDIASLVHSWKYIIKEGCVSLDDGLPMESTQKPGTESRLARPWDYVPGTQNVFVQSCEEYLPGNAVPNHEKNQKNLEEAARSAMNFGYRLSVQMHKLAKLP